MSIVAFYKALSVHNKTEEIITRYSAQVHAPERPQAGGIASGLFG